MAATPTKTELIARTRQSRAAWEESFGAIPGDKLLIPGAAGYWSAKDLQAHLTTDHRWITGQLRALVRGEVPTADECYGHDQTPPPGTDLADQDRRNAWWLSIDRERSLDEVLATIPEHADALEAAIDAVPDNEFPRAYTFADNAHIAQIRLARDGEPGWPLGAIIASYADEHYDTHTADLRAAWEHGLYTQGE
jgi:hypothetical protein